MAANMNTHNDIDITLEDDILVARIAAPDKIKDKVVIKPCNKWGHFGVFYPTGRTPKELSGTYTSMPEAIDVVRRYLKNSKPTARVKVDQNYERRHRSKKDEEETVDASVDEPEGS